MTIFGFNKKEIFSISIILAVIGVAIYLNLSSALKRARDVQRRNDLWRISDALIEYHKDRASFPPTFEGKIVACFGGVDEHGIPQAVPCDWHADGLSNIFTGQVFLENLPTDPHHNQGARYLYLSNGRYFQIYAALESEDDPEYKPEVVARNLMCGNRQCNFGRAFLETPLDKTIEEYENELRAKQKLNEDAK